MGVWLVCSSCSDTALYGCDGADAVRRKEVEQQGPRVPVHLHLGYLAVCLPCCTYGWWLCREKQLHCSVSGTPGTQRRWSWWAWWPCKGRAVSQSFPKECYPFPCAEVETGICWVYLPNKSLQLFSMVVYSNRLSHKWRSLHGILSAAGCLFFLII